MRGEISLGVWAVALLVVLRMLRRLRGTPLDPFGRAHVRRVERALIPEYEALDVAAGSARRPRRAARLEGGRWRLSCR
ncbi:uncharacterized protein SOCE836_050760 [Sorangium cellulosum]|uniref:DUF6537 domain-containing protein n=2 Tax=Polyangiaceae TaxID=49 RepID=A0A4P2QRQ9_SORCE|nr:DUF6537 domain-containing protein [Sorangium cellulosum]AUX32924.1 uncharacterized protein SOCE836_050760 [Sorangium cellulosum]WCQ92300.1 hypothetical protein NQZ70_05041 [Sorangium sp. Soce836]